MKPPKRPFDSKGCDLTGSFQPSSKGNMYVVTCTSLIINYAIAIPNPDKTAETVFQAFPQHIYAKLVVPLYSLLITEKSLRMKRMNYFKK